MCNSEDWWLDIDMELFSRFYLLPCSSLFFFHIFCFTLLLPLSLRSNLLHHYFSPTRSTSVYLFLIVFNPIMPFQFCVPSIRMVSLSWKFVLVYGCCCYCQCIVFHVILGIVIVVIINAQSLQLVFFLTHYKYGWFCPIYVLVAWRTSDLQEMQRICSQIF